MQFRRKLRSFRCLHGSVGWIRYFEQPLDHFNAEAVRVNVPPVLLQFILHSYDTKDLLRGRAGELDAALLYG